jgi:hypothetical protein
MAVPSRPERHREIKQIDKELTYIDKHTKFNALYKDKDLTECSDEDLEILEKKEHTNLALQEKYNTLHTLFSRIVTLEARRQYLKEGYKAELSTQVESDKEHPDFQPKEAVLPQD